MFRWSEESAAFWADSAAYTRSYDLLAERAGAYLAPGSTVFEGGCGLGYLSEALAKRGFAVTAMDSHPLPLRYLRARAAGAAGLTVRRGDVFALPEGERYDNAVFCFFGGLEETLSWARAHCRDRLVLFKKNWAAHRFTRDEGAPRRFTFPLTCARLDELGVPYETEVFDADMGQPFAGLADAVRFFRLYDPAGAMDEGALLPRLTETPDPAFPYFFSAIRPVGMLLICADDLRAIPYPKEEKS